MRDTVVAFISGFLFGTGLCLSTMVNPARVLGFLDVAGHWDATLLLVMAGALSVTFIGFTFVLNRSRPVYAEQFNLTNKTSVDKPLLIGSLIFGAGWGLAGLCPGPAITALATMSPSVVLFVVAMIAGQVLASQLEKN